MRDLPRDKPRHWSLTLSYRAYRVARRLLPSEWLARRLLNASWILQRLALEQVWRVPSLLRELPADEKDPARPHTAKFLRSNLRARDRVLDFGGGLGHASLLAANEGAMVTYVDASPDNASAARARCRGLPVDVVLG